MTSKNPWDILSKKAFDIHRRSDEIDPVAADNILIAWPVLLKLIVKDFPDHKGLKVLDFGCGTGAFCTKLDQMGFEVTGIDSSREMIKIAKANSAKSIRYILGDRTKLPKNEKFQIITSIMTLPYIEDLEATIRDIGKILQKDGLFIIADFNRDWVEACLELNIYFKNFDSANKPGKGMKTFGEIEMAVFIRDIDEYQAIMKKHGLNNKIEAYPPFTDSFKKMYPDYLPNHVPEYMILGYKKN